MPARIMLEASADTSEELRDVLTQLFGGQQQAYPMPSAAEAMAAMSSLGGEYAGMTGFEPQAYQGEQAEQAEPKKRGRPRGKNKANGALPEEPVADPSAADPLGLDTLPGSELPLGPDEVEPDELPPDALAGREPGDLLKEGSTILKRLVEANPSHQATVKELRTKYGVTYFKDVPPARAAEFLSDVLTAEATAGGGEEAPAEVAA